VEGRADASLTVDVDPGGPRACLDRLERAGADGVAGGVGEQVVVVASETDRPRLLQVPRERVAVDRDEDRPVPERDDRTVPVSVQVDLVAVESDDLLGCESCVQERLDRGVLAGESRLLVEFVANGVDPTDIAPHADAGITAYHAVKKAARELNPGDHAVVIGVDGLGHIGLQCLDAMSAATITAIDLKPEARELAADLGADHTIDPENEDVPEEVAALTDDTGAAQVLDFVGADVTTGYAPDVVAAGGDHHVVGYGGHVHEPAQALVNGEFSFRGTLVGKYAELQELVALVESGDVDLRTSRYDLGDVNTVAERLEHREIEGRAVITP
jgi:hypothetical protein